MDKLREWWSAWKCFWFGPNKPKRKPRPRIELGEVIHSKDPSKWTAYVLQCGCEPMVEHCDDCDKRRELRKLHTTNE